MAKNLFNNGKNYTFDFSGKRVKENGKLMTKFSMGYMLEHCGISKYHWNGLNITFNEEIYSYDEVKEMFRDFLEEEQFDNVEIIRYKFNK